MRIFSGIQPTGRKHLGNYIGAITPVRGGPGPRRRDLLHRRPARDHRRRTSPRRCASRSTTPPRCCWPRGSTRTAASSSARATSHEHTELCWLLASVTAFGDLQPHDPVQGEVGGSARARVGGAVPLSGAAGGRRARLPGPRGARRRGPAPAHRADARRRRSASTRASARRSSCPRAGFPEVGARIMDLQHPEPQDVDHRRQPSRARCWCSTTPETIAKKIKSAVTDSGSEVRRGAGQGRASPT